RPGPRPWRLGGARQERCGQIRPAARERRGASSARRVGSFAAWGDHARHGCREGCYPLGAARSAVDAYAEPCTRLRQGTPTSVAVDGPDAGGDLSGRELPIVPHGGSDDDGHVTTSPVG